MEQVWKCDFCTQTNKIKDNIAQHEVACFLNPANKGCHTCNNCETECWGGVGNDYCTLGFDVFGMKDGECDKWEIKVKQN